MSADSSFCKGTTFWGKVAKTHNESLSSTTQNLTLGVCGMDLQGMCSLSAQEDFFSLLLLIFRLQ